MESVGSEVILMTRNYIKDEELSDVLNRCNSSNHKLSNELCMV